MNYSRILARAAGLLNDRGRAVYTDAVLLEYLNTAREELQEVFELNNIPVTNATSSVINVPAGITEIGFEPATVGDPVLPSGLVEIQNLWESLEDQEAWTPVTRVEFLPQGVSVNGSPVTYFSVYAWQDQKIKLLESSQDNDLKLDYIKSLFTELSEGQLGEQNSVLNTDTFLFFNTAALAAEFIDENHTRAQSLASRGGASLERSLGISIKGRQSISTRRRPFRAAWKSRRLMSA